MKQSILIILGLTILISCQNNHPNKDYLNLKSKLSGKWKAKAFDGELHEVWTLGTEGWMEQQGFYIENNDTTYAAKSQIRKVGEDVILFSVIKNSTPKIFKSISTTDDQIIFKNDDYKNPYQVTYKFISNNKYRRTIKGVENDSIVIYEFNFEKIN